MNQNHSNPAQNPSEEDEDLQMSRIYRLLRAVFSYDARTLPFLDKVRPRSSAPGKMKRGTGGKDSSRMRPTSS